jgi:hypothetical protein
MTARNIIRANKKSELFAESEIMIFMWFNKPLWRPCAKSDGFRFFDEQIIVRKLLK